MTPQPHDDHVVEASQNGASARTNVGVHKQKPICDPLNSKVEHLSVVVEREKAHLERQEFSKSGVPLEPAKNTPGPTHKGSQASNEVLRTMVVTSGGSAIAKTLSHSHLMKSLMAWTILHLGLVVVVQLLRNPQKAKAR